MNEQTDSPANKLAETILRDVPRYGCEDQPLLPETDVLAALTAAMAPDLAERAGEVLIDLQTHDSIDDTIAAAADLITALLTANAALRARIDTMIDPDTVQKMLDDAQPIMAEACAGYEAQNAALTARVERLREAVWLKVGECLAGTTHAEVSQEARARIKRALDAALTTEEGHER